MKSSSGLASNHVVEGEDITDGENTDALLLDYTRLVTQNGTLSVVVDLPHSDMKQKFKVQDHLSYKSSINA